MDGMNWPPSLLDLLTAQAAPARRKKANAKGRKAHRVHSEKGGGFSPLVKQDGLFFRFKSQAAWPGACPPAVGQAFPRAFADVWAGIPGSDRHRLLDYWHSKPYPTLYGESLSTRRPQPLIQVVDVGSDATSPPTCHKFGTELTFPAVLVAEQPDRLPFVIARALAQSFLFANGEHWRLIVELIEDPLARWERQKRTKVTDAARDKKLDALEKVYFRAYEAEMARVMSRWGFPSGKA